MRRRLNAALFPLLAAAALIAGCGGGGGQVEPFKPTRMLSFGDESSLLLPDGRRFGVNDFKRDSNGALITPREADCNGNRIWNQEVAAYFGLVFAGCNPTNAAVTALQYATLGAKVADVRAQIDLHLASGSVGPKDLITVMVGTNDIRELYALYPTQTEAQLRDQVVERGRALADQVNRLANANGRVVVLTIPDLGSTPFGVAQKAANTDTDRAALLSRLTEAYNTAMRLRLLNDGRLIGLVLGDEAIAPLVRFAPGFGLANVTQGVCSVAPPNCNVETVVTDGNAFTWLWADDTRLGPTGQSRLGSAAVTRAANNPF